MITRAELLDLFHVDVENGTLRWKRAVGRAVGRECAGYPMTDHHGNIYWCVTINRKIYRRARLIFLAAEGRFPQPTVDHANGNKLDDSIANLREATFAQNSQNRHAHKKVKTWPRGVSQNPGKTRFKARIICNKAAYHLGYFDTPEQAGAAYQSKRKELFGEFA